MPKRPDATGRNANDRHIRLYSWLTSSPAWFDLSGNAVKLLIYIATFDNGANNGELFMSERHAAEGINVTKKTVHRLFVELQDNGFIAQTAAGSFKAKRSPAAQWRLTFKPWPAASKGPTNEWRGYRSSGKRREQILPAMGVISSHTSDDEGSTGVEITPMAKALSQISAKVDSVKSIPQLIATGRDDRGHGEQPPFTPHNSGGPKSTIVTGPWVASSCEQCGDPFQTGDRGKPKRFCSEKCRRCAESKRRNDRRREARA